MMYYFVPKMFSQRGAEPSPLVAADYGDPEVLRRELVLLRDSWQLVAAGSELAHHGDYVAADVAGVPVVVRNEHGTLRAFVNVCAHRQSLVVPLGRGRSEQLKCSYHGWCYGPAGELVHVPDRESFNGLHVERLRLAPIAVEQVGELVLVRAGRSSAPLFAETIGALHDELRTVFERPLSLVWRKNLVVDVNWKVLIDNAVESYHVPIVHPLTFGHYRPPEHHDHLLAPTFTRYRDAEPASRNLRGIAMAFAKRLVLGNADLRRELARTTHVHVFPNLLLNLGDLFCDAAVVTPLGPRRSSVLRFGFMPQPAHSAVASVHALLARALGVIDARISGEDAAVWPRVQAGLDARPRSRAVLGAREERVLAWQRWLVTQLRESSPLDPRRAPGQPDAEPDQY
ncbi:MAG TPA: SRPBCC family protein [Kofleriaceae bacterium]|jgi:choline monooxygenase